MEEALRLCALLMLLLCAEHTRGDTGVMEMIGIQSGSVTFSLGIPAEQFKSAAWTVNQTKPIASIGAGNPPTVLVTHSSYEGRLRASPENYSLQLTDLRLEDTGTYTARITTTGGIIHKQFTLRVYRQVPKPAIACDSVSCVNETCDYNLSCQVQEGGDNVAYQWTHQVKVTSMAIGPILRISHTPFVPLAVTCTARNPVSNDSTTISAKDVCTKTPSVLAPLTSLSYCHIKGLILLLVLVAMGARIIMMHVLHSREQRQAES